MVKSVNNFSIKKVTTYQPKCRWEIWDNPYAACLVTCQKACYRVINTRLNYSCCSTVFMNIHTWMLNWQYVTLTLMLSLSTYWSFQPCAASFLT